MDHDWRISEWIYALGDMFCHQQTDRSFVINGSQTAFCSRDVGMIFGFASGLPVLGYILERTEIRGTKLNILGLLFLAVLFGEWAVGAVMGYDLKYLRFLSGTAGGIGIAMLFQSYAFSVWRSEGVG